MHAALVQAAVREQALKLAAVRRLRALAFLVEAFENYVALATAVLLAGAELGRQAEILGLPAHELTATSASTVAPCQIRH